NAETGELVLNLDHEAASVGTTLALSPDGRYLAASSAGKVKVWLTANGEAVHALACPEGIIRCFAFSRDGRFLAAGSGKTGRGDIRVWELSTGAEAVPLAGHSGRIRCVDFSADGRRLVSVDEDRVMKVWELATGQELLNLPVAFGASQCLFSPDGRQILT